MSEVKLNVNKENGYFYIEVDGKEEGKMTFVFEGDHKIVIEHTEVNPRNEGKGYGKKMVTKAVEYARKKELKIIPQCSFVKSVFDQTPEFSDVL